MKTRLAAIALAAVLGALAGASGCTVDNRASIQVRSICAPSADCTFKATCDAQYIGYPTLDQAASASGNLWLFIEVANQLPNTQDLATGRLNTNDAHVDETAIEYEGALAGTSFVGSNIFVPAQGSSIVSVTLSLGSAVAGTAAAPSEVVAHVRLRGYLDDGTRFETGDFPITVKVCDTGCAPTAAAAGCDLAKPVCPADGQLPFTCTPL